MEFNVKYGAGNNYLDVTQRFIDKHLYDLENDKVRIPYGSIFNNLFTDSCPGKGKYLCISFRGIKYIVSEKYPRTTILNLEKEKKINKIKVKEDIHIVYFAYIKDIVQSKKIVFEQLKELKTTGILEYATLHLCLTFDNCFLQTYVNEILEILQGCNIKIELAFVNRFEYQGIKKVWDIAHQNPNSIILYFHSKGMMFRNPSGTRTFHERVLFNTVVKSWTRVLKILENENINKVGHSCSRRGFCWFNFWWAKASYFLDMNEPIITTDRYYYESYIGKKQDEDCYNLFDDTLALATKSQFANLSIDDCILQVSDDWLPDF